MSAKPRGPVCTLQLYSVVSPCSFAQRFDSMASTASADRKSRQAAKAAKAAKAHMEKAALASQEGRNEDALKELEAAYALDPKPLLLLARGHVYVKLSRCEEAIKVYEEFLATKPAQELAAPTTEAIDTCKAALAPPPPPPPPPPPRVVTSEEINLDEENPTAAGVKRPTQAPVRRAEPAQAIGQVDAPTRRRWFTDPLLLGLGAGGVLAIAGGVVLYTSARGKLDDAEAAPSYDEWRTLDDEAHSLRLYSILCGAAGAAFIGGAVFYYVSKYSGDEESRVTISPSRGGGVVGWTGRF